MRVLSYRLRFVAALLLVTSCQETPPLYPASASPELRQACALTERKCTACHDRERIVDARHNATEWRNTVERMRRFPGSAITPADSEMILRCLSDRAE